ncbi:MAG: cation diffusion facilitator family transporter [Nitrospinaceae bacterium]|jgi:cobalt-zinc-cadmium efflux system protein|nr:cation diffusion facilitator family transporter [Nitrospinaceae bacterium]
MDKGSKKSMDSHIVQKRLKLAVLLTFSILCVEVVGGILANSLALLSDAAHMLADVLSLCLSWFALKIARLPSNGEKTYGYHRIEILASVVNGLMLILMACGILYEALQRYQSPPSVNSEMVMVVAAIGLAANLIVIYYLKDPFQHTHDLNLKSAFFHVLGDLIASVGVLVGGGIIWLTGWNIVDPLLATGISLLLFLGAWNVLSEALHILLEGVPKGVSLSEVKRELQAIPAIQDIHELHIWCICSNIYALSTHALIHDSMANQFEKTLKEIKSLLADKFNIKHSTIQFETHPCEEDESLCDISH